MSNMTSVLDSRSMSQDQEIHIDPIGIFASQHLQYSGPPMSNLRLENTFCDDFVVDSSNYSLRSLQANLSWSSNLM